MSKFLALCASLYTAQEQQVTLSTEAGPSKSVNSNGSLKQLYVKNEVSVCPYDGAEITLICQLKDVTVTDTQFECKDTNNLQIGTEPLSFRVLHLLMFMISPYVRVA